MDIRDTLQSAVRRAGYELHRIHRVESKSPRRVSTVPKVEPLEPTWPLPRDPAGPSDAEIRQEFEKFASWHYAYSFEGGLSFEAHHKGKTNPDAPDRPLQRFRHFMPYVVNAAGGSLRGKRVLDMSCNSGFWSTQCALLGADVVGFDIRPELIEQANLIKRIVGLDTVEFRVLDFWDANPESLGGTFDAVLNLGVLYHLAKPLEALEITRALARNVIVLDTTLYRSDNAVIKLLWEEPHDIQMAGEAGIAAFPSKPAVDLMLQHVGFASYFQIPLRNSEMPSDFLNGRRATWLITV